MAWFKDLAPWTYALRGAQRPDPRLKAVGWLEAGRRFTNGRLDRELLVRLHAMLVRPFDPHVFRGFHECDLCDADARDRKPHSGALNLFVPSSSSRCVFVAPSLVLHYMIGHAYEPPAPFRAAVMACPEPASAEHVIGLLSEGPDDPVWVHDVLMYVRHFDVRLRRAVALVSPCVRLLETATTDSSPAIECLTAIGPAARDALPALEAARLAIGQKRDRAARVQRELIEAALAVIRGEVAPPDETDEPAPVAWTADGIIADHDRPITYAVGERVRIREGRFENMEGVVLELPAERRVRVSIDEAGRATEVELSIHSVERPEPE